MNQARKIRRKRQNKMRKLFMKDFKKKMREFKKQVKCSKCDYHPLPGENIDDWHIDQESNNIDLVCPACVESMEAPQDEI